MKTFENIIFLLKKYWSKNGCIVIQPFDIEIGAGTLHPITFMGGINPNNISAVYVQPSRRPIDSKYGKHSYKLQYYFQLQVIMKPIPNNIQDLYIKSLEYVGINSKYHDIKFLEDNWENTTLSSWGVGWEIRLDGLEISQFTYFQQIGGIYCYPIMVEITYGLERLTMIIQKINKINNIIWSIKNKSYIKYKDILCNNEIEQSYYNLKYANIKNIICRFNQYESEAYKLLSLKKPLIFPSYECILKTIHHFNILDSRNYFSILERKSYIIRIQYLSKHIASIYFKSII